MVNIQDTPSNDKGTNITISVNITKIVKYVCCSGIAIVAIIFGARACQNILKNTLN